MEVSLLENFNEAEKKIFNFLETLDFENISKILISPELLYYKNHTIFYFQTKEGQEIKFMYRENQKVYYLKIWNKKIFLGKIAPRENEEKQKWLNDVWEQFVEHFNLRIRLMFINEENPWKWNTEIIC